MKKQHFDAIRAIKMAQKFERFWNEETKEGLASALELLRTISSEADEKDRQITAVSNLYKFHTSEDALDDHAKGYNEGIRDALCIIDPERTRYGKGN